jgi:AcrR family transcriptional regulator
MARRSDNTREELKEMAIQAGLALLNETGIETLSARQIAMRMGYTVGTLYNVFADFEDIVLHLNAATVLDMKQRLIPIARSKKMPHRRILDFAHCYGDYAMEHPARWNLLHRSVRTTKLPEWFYEEVHQIFALVEAPLIELCPARPAQAAEAAKVLWAGLHGICALSISQKLEAVSAAPLRALIDNFVNYYLKGLQTC